MKEMKRKKSSSKGKADVNSKSLPLVGPLGSGKAMGEIGRWPSKLIDGEYAIEGDFVTVYQVNSPGAAGATSNITLAGIATNWAGTSFARLWNNTGTALFQRFRPLSFAVTAAPFVRGTLGVSNYRSLTAAYAITGASSSATAPNSAVDVLGVSNSMLYVAPQYTTTALTGGLASQPYCSKRSMTVTYKINGTDRVWYDATVPPTTNLVSIYYYGDASASEVSSVFVTMRAQLSGISGS